MTQQPETIEPTMIIALAPVPPKYKGDRSGHCFNVEVNGTPWAHVHRESRGRHGYKYSFVQANGSEIDRPHPRPRIGRDREQVIVWSAGRGEITKGETTETRLIDCAKRLIAEGLMIHPDEKARKNEQQHRDWRKRQQKHEQQKLSAFRQKAIQALAAGGYISPTGQAIEAVVFAMKWAQSQ